MTRNYKRLAMAATMLLSFVVPAAAQFDVSPDHFDEPAAPVAAKATPVQQEIQGQITEQLSILDRCQAQINAKTDEMKSTLQSLSVSGNEAGEAEALMSQERQLEALNKTLAPQMAMAQAKLTTLHGEMEIMTAKATKPVKHAAMVRTVSAQQKPSPATVMQASLNLGR